MFHRKVTKQREMFQPLVTIFEIPDPEIGRIERSVTQKFPISEQRVAENYPKTGSLRAIEALKRASNAFFVVFL
jgi:hypothetical protein